MVSSLSKNHILTSFSLGDTYCLLSHSRQSLPVELDREKAMKEMQSEVAGLALTAVSRILQEGTDPQSDGALYEQFLKKAGEANDTDR